MIQISLPVLRRILNGNLHIIIIGEVHGSKQNAPLMRKLLSLLLKLEKTVAIAFEWNFSLSEGIALHRYVHGGPPPRKRPDFFFHSDGRFTVEHASLLSWIRKLNQVKRNTVDVLFFDNQGKYSGEADLAAPLSAYQKSHPRTILLIETGNWHARKNMKGKNRSMASYLQDEHDIFCFFIRYLAGTVNVDGKYRDVTRVSSQRENPELYFDAILTVPRSTAAETITPLTPLGGMI